MEDQMLQPVDESVYNHIILDIIDHLPKIEIIAQDINFYFLFPILSSGVELFRPINEPVGSFHKLNKLYWAELINYSLGFASDKFVC